MSPTRPPVDTAPIPFDKLSPEQRTLIEEINARLRGIKEEGRKPGVSAHAPYPWPHITEDRRHRVVMLDGPRGSGKTSLLLTLLHGWQRDASSAPDRKPQERALFDGMGKVVRPLVPLDFNPLPPHVHPYPWLVLSLGRLVKALDDGNTRTSPSWGPMEDQQLSLRESWKRLHRSAEIGWRREPSPRQDLDQEAADALEEQSRWMSLEDDWRRFIGALLEQAERRELVPPGVVLVLPIDDLDLHPTISDDVLMALRKISHPRVVPLLAGSHRALQRAVRRALLVRQFKDFARVNGSISNQDRRLTDRLAEDLVDKAIPPAAIVNTPLLTFSDALEVRIGGPTPWPAQDDPREREEQRLLRTKLDFIKKAERQPLVRPRALVQLAQRSRMPNDADIEDAILDVLEACWDREFEDVMYSRDPTWNWKSPAPEVKLHYWTVYGGVTNAAVIDLDKPRYHVRWTTPSADGSLLLRSSRPSKDGARRTIDPLSEIPHPTDLLLYLEDSRQLATERFEQLDVDCSFALTVECTLRSRIKLELPFPIPEPVFRGIDHEMLAQRWGRAIVNRSFRDADAALWWWIWFHLGEPVEDLEFQDRAELDDVSSPSEKHWRSLLERLAKKARHASGLPPRGDAHWALRAIPTLAAPEYGLSTALQRQLLEWLHKIDRTASWMVICAELDDERGIRLGRSVLYFSSIEDESLRLSAAMIQLGEPKSAVGIVEAELESMDPDAPWRTKHELAQATTDLLEIRTEERRDRLRDIMSRVRIPHPRDHFDNKIDLFQPFITSYEKESPNWATSTVSHVLRTGTLEFAIRAHADRLQRGIDAPANFMKRCWDSLVEELLDDRQRRHDEELRAWISSPDAKRIEYHGPPLKVGPLNSENLTVASIHAVAYVTWTVETGVFLPISDERVRLALAAWVLLCQSFSQSELDGFERIEVQDVALCHVRQHAFLIVSTAAGVVGGLYVCPQETGEQDRPTRCRKECFATVGRIDSQADLHRLALGVSHLGSDGPLPDQLVQPQFRRVELRSDLFGGTECLTRWADRLVCLLGILRLVRIGAGLIRQISIAVTLHDLRPSRSDSGLGQRR